MSDITKGLTILIAEDSLTQAQRLRHILEEEGYRVVAAANGRLALDMAIQSKPALIISDVMMPEMDGYELSSQVKSHASLRDVPLILVTTMSDPEDVIRGLECGADNFILKPYEDRYLLSRVQYALFNREIRGSQEGNMGVEIFFNGKRHFITADRLQVLNLLLSTYDAAIQRNKQLKRSQDELQLLNAKLKDANDELESFSYSVSHDLRAPLRHIDAFASMLENHTRGNLAEDASRCLRIIRVQSQRMRQMIEDLLSFSRTSRAAMLKSRIDLTGMVQEVIQDLTLDMGERKIDWVVSALPPVVGDPALIRQVFANLVGNAVKYTRPRDRCRIEIGATPEAGGEVTVFVKDNGVGFDMVNADKLFGVFQRLHTEEEFEGTGIGLANVRRIVVRHGGKVWAKAAPGEGATFYFTLRRYVEEVIVPRV